MKTSLALALVAAFFMNACASSSGSKSGGDSSGDNFGDDNADGKENRQRGRDRSDSRNSEEQDNSKIEDKKLVDLTYSRSNNEETRLNLKRRKAEPFVAKYSKASNLADLLFGMSASRISGKGISPSLDIAQKIMILEVRKSIDRDVPDYAKVELVLAAIDSKKYELANYFVAQLKDPKRTKNPSYRASAWNADGIMLLSEGSIPEAELAWEQALKEDPKFMAARLNLGFTAARYGDLKKAKDLLDPYSENLGVAATLVSVYRMVGSKKAGELCERLEKGADGDATLLINCALYAMDSEQDLAKASKMFKSIVSREKRDPQIRKIAQERLAVIRQKSAKDQEKSESENTSDEEERGDE